MPRVTAKRRKRPADYRHASIAAGRVITTLVVVLAALVAVVLASAFLDPLVTRALVGVVIVAGIAAVVLEARRDDPVDLPTD